MKSIPRRLKTSVEYKNQIYFKDQCPINIFFNHESAYWSVQLPKSEIDKSVIWWTQKISYPVVLVSDDWWRCPSKCEENYFSSFLHRSYYSHDHFIMVITICVIIWRMCFRICALKNEKRRRRRDLNKLSVNPLATSNNNSLSDRFFYSPLYLPFHLFFFLYEERDTFYSRSLRTTLSRINSLAYATFVSQKKGSRFSVFLLSSIVCFLCVHSQDTCESRVAIGFKRIGDWSPVVSWVAADFSSSIRPCGE
jgi:hypothetical protein